MKLGNAGWFVAFVLSLAFLGCKDGESAKAPAGGEKLYDMRGKVMSINTMKPALTVKHEDIPGLMKAMQMDFRLEDAKLLDGIHVGDQIQGQVKKTESGLVITRLEKRTDE
jgi:Cu/Ag efflux protein CusF